MTGRRRRLGATTEQILALRAGQVLVNEGDIGRPVVTEEEFLAIACGVTTGVPA